MSGLRRTIVSRSFRFQFRATAARIRRREVGAHDAFQVDGEVGASLQVRQPPASRGRGNAADEDLAVDVVKDDLDSAGPPALPPDSRDVDDPAAGERTLHPLVQLGTFHDLYNLCTTPIHPWRFGSAGLLPAVPVAGDL